VTNHVDADDQALTWLDEDRLHEECGWDAAQSGLDFLIAVGGDPAKRLAEAARTGGMRPDRVEWVATSDLAAAAVVRAVRAGDLVLVKGSRSNRLERVVEALVGSPSEHGNH